MTTPDERFEERLLRELRGVVAERPAPAPATATAPRRPRRSPRLTPPRIAVGGVTAVAAAATAFVLAPGGGAEPAYAVEPAPDGSITVEISSLSDADGLERALREVGIPAVVDYLPDGKVCREPRFEPAGPEPAGTAPMTVQLAVADGATTFTVPPGSVGPRETLVVTSNLGAGPTSVATAIARGPVTPCELVDAPADGPIPNPPEPSGGPVPGDDGPSLNTSPDSGADEGPGVEIGPDPGNSAPSADG